MFQSEYNEPSIMNDKKFFKAVSFSYHSSVIRAERSKGVNRMQINKRVAAGDIQEQARENSAIEPFFSSLQQYCQFLAQNGWDGDDLFQETIIKAIRHYESSQLTAALLKKIAYHHWVDTIRKRKHEALVILDEFIGQTVTSSQIDVMETVEQLMEKLTPKQSIIFILKEAFRFQSAEIAGLLGLTEMAVKSSLHRSRRRLEKEETIRELDSFINEDEEGCYRACFVSPLKHKIQRS